MTSKEMEKIAAHFNKYFEQDNYKILHPLDMVPHIDALLYAPSEKYPFWKMVSMGASDYKMNAPKNALGRRNEYIMTIDPDEDMTDPAIARWYYANLVEIAAYPALNKAFISYGHSIEWPVSDGEEMVGAFLEFPQAIEGTGILRCKLGLCKTVICLQAILINRTETEELLKIGPQAFSRYLYPEDGSKPHFLCERTRTHKF